MKITQLQNSDQPHSQILTSNYKISYLLTNSEKQTSFTIYFDEDKDFHIQYNNYHFPTYLFSTENEDFEGTLISFIQSHFTHLINQNQHLINPLPYYSWNS